MKLSEPTIEALERISDAQWNEGKGKGVKTDGVDLNDVYTINACNHVLSGIIQIEDEMYGFVIESGNNRGTVVIEWGDAKEVACFEPPPPPEPISFVPTDPFLHEKSPVKYRVYLQWREEAWFKEKERHYNYDRHFQPGCKVENYYRDWAAKKGMKPGYASNLPDIARGIKAGRRQLERQEAGEA